MIIDIFYKKKLASGLLLLFFLIPSFTILGPFIPDLIISVTVIFFIIISLTENKDNKINILFKDTFIKIFILFYFYLLFISLINFINQDDFSFENFKNFFSRSLFLFRFFVYPLALLYLISNFKLEIKKNYFFIILLTIFFVIFDCIFQYLNGGKDIFGFVAEERGSNAIGRLSGPFGDELIPGSYLMRYFFIGLLSLYFVLKKKIFNYAMTPYIFIFLLTILLTGERSAFILATFGVFIYFLIFSEYRRSVIISTVLVFFLATLVLLLNPILKKRVINETLFQLGVTLTLEKKLNLGSIDINLEKIVDSHYGAHWETAYRIWEDNKLIGIGLKQFRTRCSDDDYNDIQSKLRTIRCATHPHNTYFELLSETGAIGLLIFLTLIFVLYKKILKLYKLKKSIKFLLISVILLTWPIITTGSFFTNQTLIYFSFLITNIFFIENNLLKKLETQK